MKRWTILTLMALLTALCVWIALKDHVPLACLLLLVGFEFLAYWSGEPRK